MHMSTNVLQSFVPEHRTRQQAGFQQDLKAIADSDDQSPASRKPSDGFHNRRESSDGAGPQVVPVGETAGNNNGVATFQVLGLMPDELHRLLEHLAYHVISIMLAVAARENQHSKFHNDSL